MKLFITGIGGFLGGHLAAYWSQCGHSVSGTSRKSSNPGVPPGCRVVVFSLGGTLPREELSGCDALIHCAYDSAAGVELNVAGTKAVCSAAEAAGVAYQVFVSSYAARPESKADYGRMKFELESYFLGRGHTAVRPGLVLGNGGMFGRNVKNILRSPVIPLLDGGKDIVAVIAVEDFVKAMDAIVSRRLTGALNLFNPQLVPMRKLVETINTAAGRRPPTVSVPLRIALLLLAISEKLRLPLPFGADNVRSLKQSRAGVYQSDLETIVAEPCRFEPAVEAVVRAVTEGMAARRVQFHS